MCGEELPVSLAPQTVLEIPPRVRRRDPIAASQLYNFGNTSACAEKRRGCVIILRAAWKYLRVCGEEAHIAPAGSYRVEIPPRVRRRACGIELGFWPGGNTSACAEKRGRRIPPGRAPGKYLRVCGEEMGGRLGGALKKEIPPRVRRRVADIQQGSVEDGNTSACAEKRT